MEGKGKPGNLLSWRRGVKNQKLSVEKKVGDD